MKAAVWPAIITGTATIVAAFVTVFLAYVQNVWHWGSGGTQASIPLSISITSPSSKVEVPMTGADFTGRISGLKYGQTVWLFSKQETSGTQDIGTGVVTANEGPCDVIGDTWDCPETRIGGSHRQDSGKYLVWAAVLSPSQARDLEYDLVNHAGVVHSSESNELVQVPFSVSPGGLYKEELQRL